MYKVLFDIGQGAEPGQENQPVRVLLEMGERHLHYLVTSLKGQLIKVKYFLLDPHHTTEVPELLKEIMHQEFWLQQQREQEMIILYHFPENVLVPAAHFNLEQNRSLLELVNGDLHKGSILSEKVRGRQLYNLFRIPAPIHNLVQEAFRNGKYWHFYSLHVEAITKMIRDARPVLWITFYSSRILVVALSSEQLYSVQGYDYQQAEDAAFYLLKIAAAHGFDPAQISLMVEGLIDRDSSMFHELEKYFHEVVTVPLPESFAANQLLAEHPAHFFTPLLKLLTCV